MIYRDGNGLFTSEEENLYQTQYSGGYDIHDPKYISWIKINHSNKNCERFLLMKHFPEAFLPEEIPVVVSAGDMINATLPGSTLSCKEADGSRNVRCNLVLETPK